MKTVNTNSVFILTTIQHTFGVNDKTITMLIETYKTMFLSIIMSRDKFIRLQNDKLVASSCYSDFIILGDFATISQYPKCYKIHEHKRFIHERVHFKNTNTSVLANFQRYLGHSVLLGIPLYNRLCSVLSCGYKFFLQNNSRIRWNNFRHIDHFRKLYKHKWNIWLTKILNITLQQTTLWHHQPRNHSVRIIKTNRLNNQTNEKCE